MLWKAAERSIGLKVPKSGYNYACPPEAALGEEDNLRKYAIEELQPCILSLDCAQRTMKADKHLIKFASQELSS
eukprot:1152288-Pelagomonas_calceolata.AAC.3